MKESAIQLSEAHRQEMISHCLAALPHEGCGLLALDDSVVTRVYPTRNIDESATSFTIDPAEHYAALADAESHGWRLGGVFHSHPNGPAEMSDIDMARALEPDWVYVVVGLEGTEPEVGISRVG